mmetsp:Transcript_66297/g.190564  ORF Transcript_66297/g.190564 Transcript_66297/m.190564 type:complete len:205 (+) Transcript_66297:524-1138(+)
MLVAHVLWEHRPSNALGLHLAVFGFGLLKLCDQKPEKAYRRPCGVAEAVLCTELRHGIGHCVLRGRHGGAFAARSRRGAAGIQGIVRRCCRLGRLRQIRPLLPLVAKLQGLQRTANFQREPNFRFVCAHRQVAHNASSLWCRYPYDIPGVSPLDHNVQHVAFVKRLQLRSLLAFGLSPKHSLRSIGMALVHVFVQTRLIMEMSV